MLIKYNLWIIFKEHNSFTYLWKYGPKYSSFEEILLKNPIGSRFCHPTTLNWITDIPFVIECKEQKIGQTPKIMQFIWLSNLICT